MNEDELTRVKTERQKDKITKKTERQKDKKMKRHNVRKYVKKLTN